MVGEDDFDPVIARLQFGELARQLREAARVEFGEADRAVGGYFGKLSKIETGTIAPRSQDVDWMVERYEVASAQAEELRSLATIARRRAKPAKTLGTSRQYVSLERRATKIAMVYNEIPGLLQTAEFAYTALSLSPVIVAADLPGYAQERAERGARVIRSDGPEVRIVLGEEAFDRANGGPAVLRRQLEHLREVADMPNVGLRVLPRSTTSGIVPALVCPYTLLEVDAKTLAYVETLTRSDYIKAPAPYVFAFEHAWRLAASGGESTEILDRRIADLADTRE
ncbi:helix-turn-helix domain-containing protein [Saccharothrix sp. NRRL B-16314]|uniref:helix-turn-helix domain-containing protein n=1 Tax=Saccharothrix sp. NRRL B-16314 TaxID=1463825 RepID=UPI000525E9E7|nr:helix-turn-helix transcriptional regulator [Saccharothrix sp. NRRL B-16314]